MRSKRPITTIMRIPAYSSPGWKFCWFWWL